MTGATLLPSTDHMIKQFGDECMGSCEYFYMRVVQDDPEKMEADTKGGRRILKTRIARGSTYAYVTGCPSEKGCSIVLRGDNRNVLSEVKKILRFCIVVAYHLRLEVAYYNDRSADLPESPMDICSSLTDNESGDELTPRDGAENRKMVIDETGASLASSLATTPVESSESYPQSRRKKSVQMNKISSLSLSKSDRLLLSTSLDIDPKLPHKQELIGSHLFQGRKTNWNTTTVFDFQTLLITSLLMGDNNQQKSSAEVKGVKFYTEQDVALGKFLIENCFQLHRTSYRESRMVEHTLSYIHRPGRIDISIHRRHDHSTANQMMEEGHSAPRDPMRLPIFMESYCKVCGKVVTPSTIMSDETWKMSFGKFMEIFFYNKSARCIVDSCYHSLRDNHILSFLCEGYAARFEFVPIHPYSLHVRVGMDFPVEFYNQHVVSIMKDLPKKHATLISDFKLALGVLEKEIKDILATKPEDMALTLSDVQTMNTELYFNSISFLEKMIQSYELLPSACQKMLEEDNYKMVLIERLQALQEDKQISVRSSIDERLSSIPEVSCSFRDVSAKGIDTGTGSILPITSEEAMKMENLQQPILDNPEHLSAGNNPVSIFGIAVRFPAYHYRDTAIKAAKWNSRIDTLYKFLESVRTALLQQLNEAQLHPSALLASESIHNVKSLPSVKGKADLEPEIINREEPSIDFDQTVVESANEVIATVLPSEVSDDEPSVRSTSIVSDAKPLSSQNTSTLQAQHVSGILEHTPLSTISALSKTLLDHSKKIERPHDRVSRLPKLLTRFLVGKDLSSGEHNKFFIPLGDFGEGRYGLKPGRKGEVIAVHEDEFSTIIAYALASEEYYEQLQLSLKENENAVGKSHHSNSDLQEDFVAQTEDYRTSESVNPFFRGDDNNFDEAIQSSEQTLSKEEADVPTELIISPRLKGKGMSGMLRGRSVTAAPVLNRDVEESTRNEDIRFLRSLPRSNSEAVKKAQFVEGDAVDVERAFSQIHSSKSVIEADNLFATNAFQNPEMIDTSEIIETGKEEITMKNILNNTEKAPKRSSALNSVPQPTIGLDEKLKKQEKGKMESVTEIHGTPIIKTHSSGEVKTINEKQMISQDKSFISIRFDDTDDKGNVTCKFQCQIFWAKQFEALRNCYFKDEDNENFIKSLSLSNSWSAQGGKSGASFSKSLDDRLVIKVISKVELTMFLEFAPAYFGKIHDLLFNPSILFSIFSIEYMAKAYYHNLPSVLCKILGVYSVRSHHKESGTKVNLYLFLHFSFI